jgi:hypothetical protein
MSTMSAMKRTICRFLIVLTAFAPFQYAQAGMIGTATAVDRETVAAFVARADVARQLETLGVEPAAALERVASLDDEAIRDLSARINELPAGADAGGIVAWILIIALVWYFFFRKKPS